MADDIYHQISLTLIHGIKKNLGDNPSCPTPGTACPGRQRLSEFFPATYMLAAPYGRFWARISMCIAL